MGGGGVSSFFSFVCRRGISVLRTGAFTAEAQRTLRGNGEARERGSEGGEEARERGGEGARRRGSERRLYR